MSDAPAGVWQPGPVILSPDEDCRKPLHIDIRGVWIGYYGTDCLLKNHCQTCRYNLWQRF
jgi:hypothetical protein